MKITNEELIIKFEAGTLSEEEEKAFELRIQNNEIDLSQIPLFQQLQETPLPESSAHMDEGFYKALAEEKNKELSSPLNQLKKWWSSSASQPWHWSYGLAMILIGLVVGINWPTVEEDSLESLRAEVTEMKEVMMLSMLENESTTDRLKAVNLTQELDNVSDQVAAALLNTLRFDENNNVRMATIGVLASYTDNPKVRRGIIESIQYQESPLVQLALAELMVAMNEKGAVKAFDSLWQNRDTPPEIKTEIKQKMETLI